MQQRIKNLLKDNSLYVAVFVTVLIAYLSLKETGPQIIHLSNVDKIEHAFAYFVLSISWLAAVLKRKKKHTILLVIIACIFYGIILEVLQETITLHRTAELLDVIANSTGVLLGLLIFNQISKKNQVI